MMTSHGNSDISYNFQTSVDSKNSLIVATDVVSDVNDVNQLENMHRKSSDNLGSHPIADTADMGYFNAQQIASCASDGTKLFVKRPKSKNATNDSDFSFDKFSYDPQHDIYICPAGKQLRFLRFLKKRLNKNDSATSIVGKEYLCYECATCPYLSKCTSSVDGRRITRNVYQDALDQVQKNFQEHPDMYTLRKSTVEHPFGTIKRSLGFTYFLRRGLDAVRTEASLFALAYNFKRLPNISKFEDIIKKMEDFFLHFLSPFLHFFSSSKKIINSSLNL